EGVRRMNDELTLLRHTVATLAYRGGKAIRDVPASFADYKSGDKTRTPLEILAHIGDLFDWAIMLSDGTHAWNPAKPDSWEKQAARFHANLEKFDRRLASDKPLGCPAGLLFQGPIADALTHVGQINLLRGMAGCPVKGENYYKADIVVGRVGADQAKSKVEF